MTFFKEQKSAIESIKDKVEKKDKSPSPKPFAPIPKPQPKVEITPKPVNGVSYMVETIDNVISGEKSCIFKDVSNEDYNTILAKYVDEINSGKLKFRKSKLDNSVKVTNLKYEETDSKL